MRAIALAIHQRKLGDRHPTIAQDQQNLGSALRMAGRSEAALAHHERALELRETLFGRDDPRVAASLVGVANVLRPRAARRAQPRWWP